MKRKLVITTNDTHVISTLLENDHVAELHCARHTAAAAFAIGDIYIGKVRKIMNNVQAAFIEISSGVECYYTLDECTNLSQQLKVGDELPVQIKKEAVKEKAMTVTANLNFTGKYLVLTTGIPKVGVSLKINKGRRRELLEAMEKFRSKDYGFVVRTNAGNATIEELNNEAERLLEQYWKIMEIADKRTCYSCLFKAPEPYITDIRNIYQEGLSEIVVEDQKLHQQIRRFLEDYQPEDLGKLRLYEDVMLPLHKLYSIERAIESATREKVWLKSGAFLVIQPTEALTVIDVNSGKASGKREKNNILKLNLEAARESARQIRLRNISGIIVIDFINMSEPEQMRELLSIFRGCLSKDPIPTALIDVTKLQLVEVTRQKIRRPLAESLQ